MRGENAQNLSILLIFFLIPVMTHQSCLQISALRTWFRIRIRNSLYNMCSCAMPPDRRRQFQINNVHIIMKIFASCLLNLNMSKQPPWSIRKIRKPLNFPCFRGASYILLKSKNLECWGPVQISTLKYYILWLSRYVSLPCAIREFRHFYTFPFDRMKFLSNYYLANLILLNNFQQLVHRDNWRAIWN